MNKKLLTILITVLILGGTFYVFNDYLKGGTTEEQLILKGKVLHDRKIKKTKCTEWIESTTSTEKIKCKKIVKEDIVQYLYVSDEEVPPAILFDLSEDISKRTKNSQTFKKNKNTYIAKVSTGEPFYQEGKKWYKTDIGYTTPEAFEEQTQASWLDKLLGRTAYAATATVYVGAGDGYIYFDSGGESVWDTVHDSPVGDVVDYTDDNALVAYSHETGPNYYIARGAVPALTGPSLASNVTISSTTLYMYVSAVSDGDGDSFVRIVETTQASSTVLATADYNEFGATNTPTGIATDVDLGDIVASTYNTWRFTSFSAIKKSGETSSCGTDTGWSCIGARDGRDVNDDPPGDENSNSITINYSENASNKPYFTIEYSVAAAAEEQRAEIIIFD